MKRKFFTSFVAFLLVCAMCIGMGTPTLAASHNKAFSIDEVQAVDNIIISNNFMVNTANNAVVQVKISPELSKTISYSDVYDIISENKLNNGDVISIEEVGELNNDLLNGTSFDTVYLSKGELMSTAPGVTTNSLGRATSEITPQWKWYDLILNINTSWSYGSEYDAKDVFIASAARGETYTLTKKFESSLSLSLEAGGTYSSVTGKIATTDKISYSVEKSHTYSGPSENSSYNSTEYRVKFYAKRCYVTQNVTGNISKHTSYYNATYVVPTRYLSYSVYRKVS